MRFLSAHYNTETTLKMEPASPQQSKEGGNSEFSFAPVITASPAPGSKDSVLVRWLVLNRFVIYRSLDAPNCVSSLRWGTHSN